MEENKENILETVKLLLEENHNLVLTGAPGTGKTYLAKQVAAKMILGKEYSEASDEEKIKFDTHCGFVQFHPSFDYTDFIEGLRPEIDKSTRKLYFERKDGIFKDFCRMVVHENSVKITVDEICNEEFIKKNLLNQMFDDPEFAFKITRFENERFYYEGISYHNGGIDKSRQHILLKDIITILKEALHSNIDMIRGDFIKKNELIDTKQYKQNWWQTVIPPVCNFLLSVKKTPFVFIIDEINRGEISRIFGELFFAIDPDYRGLKGKTNTQYQNILEKDDFFKEGFYVPENVYIIGTMNDIDRSVESMDFAFRRRFAFYEVKAEDNADMLSALRDSEGAARDRMNTLNKFISEIEGLSSAYHIGASYFLKLNNYEGDENSKFGQLWNYHLEGLLREYMRGMPDADKKIESLKNAYDHPQKNE